MSESEEKNYKLKEPSLSILNKHSLTKSSEDCSKRLGWSNFSNHDIISTTLIDTNIIIIKIGKQHQYGFLYKLFIYNLENNKIITQIDACNYYEPNSIKKIEDISSKANINSLLYNKDTKEFLKIINLGKTVFEKYSIIDNKFMKTDVKLELEEESSTIYKLHKNIIVCIKQCSGKTPYLMFVDIGSFTLNMSLYGCFNTLLPQLLKEKYILLRHDNYKTILYDFVNNEIIQEIENCTIVHYDIENDIFLYKKTPTNPRSVDENIYILRLIEDNNIPEEDQCCVCFGRIKERYLMFSCGHTRTCFDCLEQIKKEKGNCPLCRTEQIPLHKLFI